jgi:phosphate butyryltransferase
MNTIQTFQQLKERVIANSKSYRIVAVKPDDEASKTALQRVKDEGLAEVVIVDNNIPEEAAQEAVAIIRNGEGDVLMKGLIGTDQVLRAILNKEHGLLPPGRVLTHISAFQMPDYPKMLFVTDVAVIPYPTQEQRIEQIRYATDICRRMGISQPRVALLHCAEHGGKQFPFVDGYADIKRMAEAGDFGPCLVDGPMDLKTACSAEALRIKQMTSPLEGESDILVMPDIEAGNTFYKAMTLFTPAESAGLLVGATAPVVIPSRGDDATSKYNSILFALSSL